MIRHLQTFKIAVLSSVYHFFLFRSVCPNAVCGFANTKERVAVFRPFDILFSCLVRAHPPPLDRIPKEGGRKAHCCCIETNFIMQPALDHSGSQKQLLLTGSICRCISNLNIPATVLSVMSSPLEATYCIYFKSKSLLLLLQGDVIH